MARITTLSRAARWAVLPLAMVLGAGAAQAQHGATVVIQSGPQHVAHPGYVVPPPPPPRAERMPSPRRGMVWSQGHWEWNGNRYHWVPGEWVRVRHGQHYRQPQWRERDGRWELDRGRWDRDGDGVPNRRDRRPDNPYRN